MTDRGVPQGAALQSLSASLRAVSAPNRLALLARLQLPHTLQEIEMQPFRRDRARSPDRPLSARAIESHLEQLRSLGFVRARASSRGDQKVTEYVVNRGRLFVLVDDLRRVLAAPGAPGALDVTEADAAPGPQARLPRDQPALVAVNGPHEGAVFALSGAGPWVVGRDRGLPVSLRHDPFVSRENTRLWRDGAGFRAANLPGARNGTRLNWGLLREGEEAGLDAGDVLGVGRSLLVLRGA